MPEQALYLKWRPLTFADVVGQEHVTRTLRNSLKSGRIRHAYLFSGPRGTGKTTSARLLAKAVNCTHPDPDQRPCNECPNCIAVNEGRFLDLIEIDAASHTGVDDVRELRDRIAFSPGEGRYKVYIIDEVHRFSGNAFDALLKTLEEPPNHAIFVLATTEIDRVPATIKSRCLPFEFRRLSLREVTERLSLIAREEGLNIEPAALELIAREGTGSVRDSISLLDQIVADPAEAITLELTQRILGTASLRAVRDLIEAIIQDDVSRGIHIINSAIDAGSDPRQFGQQVVEHLRSVLLAQTASADLLDVSADDRELFTRQAASIHRSTLLRTIRSFNEAVNNYTGGWQPQLALELALIESLQEEPAVAAVPAPPASSGGAADRPKAEAGDTPAKETGEPSMPTPEMTEPGTPPVIEAAVVRAKWEEAQRLIHQHADQAPKNLPHLMTHAQVRMVDGNVVVMNVNSPLYLEKLRDPNRTRWIERAISRVTDTPLRVRFTLSEGGEEADTTSRAARGSAADDPLIEEGLELGGQIKEDD